MSATFWRQIHGGSADSPILSVGWPLSGGGRILRPGFGIRLAGMSVAAALMAGAGCSGGERLWAAEPGNPASVSPANKPVSTSDRTAMAAAGRRLFLKNCAHCHGADAHGDEGPDLHNLDWTDQQIAARIRNGKKGQMTAFAGKFSADDIRAVIAYLRTLK